MKRVLVLFVAVALLAAGSAGTGAATPTKTLKVAMVTDSSGLNDHGFNHLAYVGLQQAQKQLGAQIRVAESKAPSDYIPNLASFARQGYDLVVGVGYTEISAMSAVQLAWHGRRSPCAQATTRTRRTSGSSSSNSSASSDWATPGTRARR